MKANFIYTLLFISISIIPTLNLLREDDDIEREDVIYLKSNINEVFASTEVTQYFINHLENPNIIIGRRSHYMTYGRSGELKSYKKWKFRQTFKKEPDFNTFLTGVGCILYPPDILNINDNYLPIINETITSDDITLKYFASQKGIPHKWVKNKFIHGLKKIIF